MSVLIVDTDTLNISLDDSVVYGFNMGPPATMAFVTEEHTEALVNGLPDGIVTDIFTEAFVNGLPDAIVTDVFVEVLVSVNRSTQVEPDNLDIELDETITKFISDYDTLDITIEDYQPGYLSDIHPNPLPLNQTFVLLYCIGFGFSNSSQIVFNGTPLTTTFVSSMELTAKVPVRLIQPLGQLEIYVSN